MELYKEKDLIYKAFKFKDTNLDSLIYYIKKIQTSTSKCDRLFGKYLETYYFYKLKKYDTIKNLLGKTIPNMDSLYKETPNDLCYIKLKINSLNRLFWVYKNSGEYEMAYEQLIKASRFINSRNNENFENFYYSLNIEMSKAIIKSDLKMEKDSKTILKKLITKLESKKNDTNNSFQYESYLRKKADICNLLGKTCVSISKRENNLSFLDSAAIYYKEAYTAAQKFIPPHPDTQLIYDYRRTEVLIAKKKYEKALQLINHFPKINYGTSYLEETNFYKAICFQNLKQADSAIHYSKKVLENKKLQKSKLITIYDILSNQYVKQRQLDSAYKYSQLTLREFDTARVHKQKTYQLLYDNDLEKVTQLNHSILEKEKNKNIKTISFITLALVIISSAFVVKRRKYKKQLSEKANEIIETTQEQEIVKEEKPQKVTYNIEEELELKILNKLNKIDLDHEYIASDFSINSIAEALQTNTTYISFVFNKHNTVTFKQYYTQKKITYVVNLLNNNSMYRKFSVQGLAEEVGYTNASAFTRAFKKHIGVTPSAYIKSLKS
ncbi:helix-turn-helix domain-containing protein [Tenacibaculum amylolyticum]|uniref:helix-turn-helix domain-containing protein n=1 Tax=Tenacibaculum amylolyticum TaxID=104269 RepID=UPI003895A4C4